MISLTAEEAAVMHAVLRPGELVRGQKGKVVGICTGKGTACEGSACGKETALRHGASAKGNAGPTLCDACYQRGHKGKVVGICTGKGTAYEGSACRKEKALLRGGSAKGNVGPTLCDACYQKGQRAKAKRSRRAKAK